MQEQVDAVKQRKALDRLLDSEWPPVGSAETSSGTLPPGRSKINQQEVGTKEVPLELVKACTSREGEGEIVKSFKALWRSECQKAFELLKCLLAEAPTLAHSNFSKPFWYIRMLVIMLRGTF